MVVPADTAMFVFNNPPRTGMIHADQASPWRAIQDICSVPPRPGISNTHGSRHKDMSAACTSVGNPDIEALGVTTDSSGVHAASKTAIPTAKGIFMMPKAKLTGAALFATSG